MPKPGPATASELETPSSVAVDSAGDLFTADPEASEVLKVSAATGALSVVAGTGTSGRPLQGPATSEELEAPTGVAVDSSGDLFIADRGASEVLEVSAATGALSVVAGTGTAGMPKPGPAASSELEAPTDVVVDASGDLFIADPGASEVGEVSFPPLVSGVSPAAGTTAGGVTVTVSGTYFGEVAAIDFGTLPARAFSCNGVNSCSAVAPLSPPGMVDITVTTPWGVSRISSSDRFSYYSALPAAPTVTVVGRTGPGQVVVSGTTTPGARVTLWAASYGQQAFSSQRSVAAGKAGTYRFAVAVHRTTRFYTRVESRQSSTVIASIRDVVAEVLTPEKGAVKAEVVTNPKVAGVDVTFYQVGPKGGLTPLGTLRIESSTGVASQTFSLAGPTVTIEAHVRSGDGTTGGDSPPRTVTVKGA